jgi:hypothetical protein
MSGTEIKTGPNTTKVMPDFIKIHEPKNEDVSNLTPSVTSSIKGGDAPAATEGEQ